MPTSQCILEWWYLKAFLKVQQNTICLTSAHSVLISPFVKCLQIWQTVKTSCHSSWACWRITERDHLAWLADGGPQLALCVAGRFPFSRCQRVSVEYCILSFAASGVLARIVYWEHATVTSLSQAWNFSDTFPSPPREWGGNRRLCKLALIQSDQRANLQHN